MTRRTVLLAAVGVLGLLAFVVGSLTVLPSLLYPALPEADLHAVSDAGARIQLQQAQGQLQNSVRSALLQLTAGLLVIGGAAATWRQVQVNREGQITERFTRAVEQLGSDNVDVRIGGVYALERVARNSSADRDSVQFLLAAFVRNHSRWTVGGPDGPVHPSAEVDMHLPWLQIRTPDIQAAMGILARRPSTPGSPRLYLSRVDLRSVQIHNGRLTDTQLRYANLARAWLPGTRLDRSDLKSTDLRLANLETAVLTGATLTSAYLGGAVLRDAVLRDADLSHADLTGADLRGADLTGARVEDTTFAGALADDTTTWPTAFDTGRLALPVP
ncbi:pentapeptide repeat-containing protein [Umezawaea tangerina]|uniref:Pentapeptide repeat protein n=1 Tax=Umezawaea tangerina TaxID=84725 RepID=A0A2T0SX07_9PSEU|nr:pentapeptide repeat-containing protein [Umezawaea tangerina]PRY37956.1 pentapeptide repeat protein [Umezawaea tangerina]